MKAALPEAELLISLFAVSLRVVQLRQSNVNRFKCNGIRNNLFDRLCRVGKVSCIIFLNILSADFLQKIVI
jgi:hypothetical protein